MSLASNTKNSESFLKSAYLTAEQMGAEMPEHKNLANLPTTVGTIETAPSLKGLKRALDNGTAPTKYPVGTEIEDTYAGNSNPLIVAQYLDNTNNSSYGGAVGVILLRKYAIYSGTNFGVGADYTSDNNDIRRFLSTTYLEKCSDDIKPLASDISIPTYVNTTSSGMVNIVVKWFIPSCAEVLFTDDFIGKEAGIAWDYWKQRTGLANPNNNPRDGRMITDFAGSAQSVWTRTKERASVAYTIGKNGGRGSYSSNSYDPYTLPCCFIAKGGNV